MASVTLEKLCKVYKGGSYAVNHADLRIENGEFITLVGPSGCGKTTTLRMVAGLLDPSSGKILFDQDEVTYLPPQQRHIGMVFQDYALFPHLNVRDNIAFGLKIQKYDPAQIKQRVDEGIRMVNLGGYEKRGLGELSGGQRQRVALARALVMEPRVFLMDEPLSNLDAKLRLHMRTELKRIHKKLGITTLYVTHDQVEAMTLSSRVVIMLDGLIQQVGTPEDVYERPINRFVGGFIGSPPMNFIEKCRIQRKGDRLFLEAQGLVIGLSKKHQQWLEAQNLQEVVAGIRPEHFAEADSQTSGEMDTIELEVDVVEPIGADKYLDLCHGDLQLKAKVSADTVAHVDQKIKLRVDLEKIHLFKPDSGKAIQAA